jgi:hypothetical protein
VKYSAEGSGGKQKVGEQDRRDQVYVYFREAQNCLPSTIWSTGFWFWYNKAVMPKEKLLLHGNLKIGPSLPLKTIKSKKENHVFIATILCFPFRTTIEFEKQSIPVPSSYHISS